LSYEASRGVRQKRRNSGVHKDPLEGRDRRRRATSWTVESIMSVFIQGGASGCTEPGRVLVPVGILDRAHSRGQGKSSSNQYSLDSIAKTTIQSPKRRIIPPRSHLPNVQRHSSNTPRPEINPASQIPDFKSTGQIQPPSYEPLSKPPCVAPVIPPRHDSPGQMLSPAGKIQPSKHPVARFGDGKEGGGGKAGKTPV
jgi:hypothetical protein